MAMLKDFTAVGDGPGVSVARGDSFAYAVAGTFVGTWVLQRSFNGGSSWEAVATGTSTQSSATIVRDDAHGGAAIYRFKCSAFTSGTIETSITESSALAVPVESVISTTEAGAAVTGTLTVSGATTITGDLYVTGQNITAAFATLAVEGLSGAPQVEHLRDTNAVYRAHFHPTAIEIVDGAPTYLFSVPLAAGESCGGVIHFAVFADDATDFQVISGIATYAAVNKAETITGAITYVSANEAKAVSSGTLTLAFTDSDETNVAAFWVQPTGSLTETTYTIKLTVYPFAGIASFEALPE